MELTIHIPRPYEADVRPAVRQDIEIRPKFYSKQGWVSLLPITSTDAKGRERRFMLSVSATNGAVKVFEMKEVEPEVDTRSRIDDVDEEDTKEFADQGVAA
jgi:hypothetical protein